MSIPSSKIILFVCSFLLFYNGFSQIVGGSSPGDLSPQVMKAEAPNGGSFSSNVSLLNGTYQGGYSLGEVSTEGGLKFELNLSYSSSTTVGNKVPVAKGIPYGENWDLSIPTITLNTATYREYSGMQRNSWYALNQDPYFTIPIPLSQKEGDIYWHSVNVNIPGVLNCRAVYKYSDTLNRKIFTPSTFEKYAEIILDETEWIVVLEDGTTYDFTLKQDGVRSPNHDKGIVHYENDLDPKDTYFNVDSFQVKNGDFLKNDLRNQITPKVEILKWFCTRISNRNIPGQYIGLYYKKFGQFNFFKEYTQKNFYNRYKEIFDFGQFTTLQSFETYRDVFLYKVEAYDRFSGGMYIDLEYETKSLATSQMLNHKNDPAVKRYDSLYNYKTVYASGINTPNNTAWVKDNFKDWKRFLHAAHDDLSLKTNYSGSDWINGYNPYEAILSSGNSYHFKKINSTSSYLDFDHGYLESNRINNAEALVPGDIYEVKTKVTSDNPTRHNFMNVDINIATGRMLDVNQFDQVPFVNSSDNLNNSQRIQSIHYNSNAESSPAQESIFSTFGSSVKWTTIGNEASYQGAQTIETSNLFIMEDLPNDNNGFFIQVGPSNSDQVFNSKMEYVSNSNTLNMALTTYPPLGDPQVSDKVRLTYKPVSKNFGIGMPWYMMYSFYQGMFGHPVFDDFWFNTDTHNQFTWNNEPTLAVGQLNEVELIRYCKNTYMLASAKKYVRTGEYNRSSGDKGVLVHQLDFEYGVTQLNRFDTKHVISKSSVPGNLNTGKVINFITLNAIKNIPTDPSRSNLNQGFLVTPTTFFEYGADFKSVDVSLTDTNNYRNLGYIILLNKITDQLGKEKKIKYYGINSANSFHNDLIVLDQAGVNANHFSAFDHESYAYSVSACVEEIKERSGDVNWRTTTYEYGNNKLSGLFNKSQIRVGPPTFDDNIQTLNASTNGFKTVKVLEPEINGKRNYTIYHNYNFDELSGVRQVLITKNWKIEKFNYNDELYSKKEIEYNVIKAYENGAQRPANNHAFFKFDYIDYLAQDRYVPLFSDNFIIDNNKEKVKLSNFHRYGEFRFYEQEYISDVSVLDRHSYFINKSKEIETLYFPDACIIDPPVLDDYSGSNSEGGDVTSNPSFVNNSELSEEEGNGQELYNSIGEVENYEALKPNIELNSPLPDDYIIKILSQERFSEEYGGENFAHLFNLQQGVSDEVQKFMLNNPLMIEAKAFEWYFSEFNQAISDNVLKELVLKQTSVDGSIVENVFTSKESHTDSILKFIMRSEPMLPHSTIEAILLNDSYLSGDVLYTLLNDTINFSGNKVENVFLNQANFPSETVLARLIEKGGLTYSENVLNILLASPQTLSPSMMALVNSNLSNFTTEEISQLENVQGNLPTSSSTCSTQSRNGALEIKSITEYDYYKANYKGISKSAGYKDLLGSSKDSVYLKYEPSWQLYSVKNYSPNNPNAYSIKKYYYYYDLQNRYDRYDIEYDQTVNGFTHDTIRTSRDYYTFVIKKLNGTSVSFPESGAMKMVKKNRLRSIAYEQKVESSNGSQIKPFVKSSYYVYDRKWGKDPTTFFNVVVKDTGNSYLCNPSVVDPCFLVNFNKDFVILKFYKFGSGKLIDTTFVNVPKGKAIVEIIDHVSRVASYYSLPIRCIRSFGIDTSIVYDPTRGPGPPIEDDLNPEQEYPRWMNADAIYLRSIYDQIDTIGKESSHNPFGSILGNNSILGFYTEPTNNPHDTLYHPIFPYDALLKQTVLERNIQGLPKLIEDEKGLRTRFVYDPMEDVYYNDTVCDMFVGRYAGVGNRYRPVEVITGSGRSDSLTTKYSYYPDLSIKSIESVDYGTKSSYQYDIYGRIKQERKDGKLVNRYSYNFWQGDTTKSFSMRTHENFMESIHFPNDSNQTAILNRKYIDPLGRDFQSITAELENGVNSDSVFKAQYSGPIVYDVRDRVVEQFKPFGFEDNGKGLDLLPKPQSNDLVAYPNVSSTNTFEDEWTGRLLESAKVGETGIGGKKTIHQYQVVNAYCLACDLDLRNLETNLIMPDGISINYRFNKHTVIDEDGKATTSYTNTAGQTLATKQNTGTTKLVTVSGYDNQGQLSTIINPKDQRSSYSYNILGWLYQTNTIDGGTTNYMYNKSGQQTLIQDEKGRLGRINFYSGTQLPYYTKFGYDDYGRLESKGEASIKYTAYNAHGGFADEMLYANYEEGDPDINNDSYYYNYKFSNVSTYDWISNSDEKKSFDAGTVIISEIVPLSPFENLEQEVIRLEMLYGDINNYNYVSTHDNLLPVLQNRSNTKGRLNQTIRYSDSYMNPSLSSSNIIEVVSYDYTPQGYTQSVLKQFNPNGISSINKGLATAQFYSGFNNDGLYSTHNIDVNADTELDMQFYQEVNARGQLEEVYANYYNYKNEGNLVASYTYDDVYGRVKSQKNYYRSTADSVLVDKVNYSYDVRDRLTGSYSNWFDYELYYDNQRAILNSNMPNGDLNYNGNINGIKSTYKLQNSSNYNTGNLFDQPSIYNYDYDGMNRLVAANAYVPDFGSVNTGKTTYTYDKVGNITQLERIIDGADAKQGWNFQFQGNTNKLSAANGISSTDDRQYTYDGTGNLKSDDSRKILDITYNESNLPIQIKKTRDSELYNRYKLVDY
ncbi:hypothetical protein GQN54_01390, partial [Cryomorphaceae bacterium S-15]|nr:hypothetical protein [Acidiluteibacter ferrifornacis]